MLEALRCMNRSEDSCSSSFRASSQPTASTAKRDARRRIDVARVAYAAAEAASSDVPPAGVGGRALLLVSQVTCRGWWGLWGAQLGCVVLSVWQGSGGSGVKSS